MRIARHLPPIRDWRLDVATRRRLTRWAAWMLGAALAGYLVAYLVLFPAPILAGHKHIPRLLGLTLEEAREHLQRAAFRLQEGGRETHPSAPRGTVVWQDPPPGLIAPANTSVTLVVSDGPPNIPVPDVVGLDRPIAERLIEAAGLTLSRVDSVQAATPRGVVMYTQPAAPQAVAPGQGVRVVVSRGAPTVTVPDLLGLSLVDARTRLEQEELELGAVTRRRTPDANPGAVVGQRPAAGTLAAPGTVVDLIVARSPQ